MPEVGLGIGRGIGTHQRWGREWLYWYDQDSNRLLTPEELIEQERQQAKEKQRNAIANLISLGLSVEQIAAALSLSIEDVQQAIAD